jgi:hypothetical protein
MPHPPVNASDTSGIGTVKPKRRRSVLDVVDHRSQAGSRVATGDRVESGVLRIIQAYRREVEGAECLEHSESANRCSVLFARRCQPPAFSTPGQS